MRVIKPLYGIAESGTYWWNTYHTHHIKKLEMMDSTYDPCLLVKQKENPEFALIGMQTDAYFISRHAFQLWSRRVEGRELSL